MITNCICRLAKLVLDITCTVIEYNLYGTHYHLQRLILEVLNVSKTH